MEYSVVAESAHRLGRALHAVDDRVFAAAVHTEVTALISEAMDIAEGKIPNLAGLTQALAEATENAEQLDDGSNATHWRCCSAKSALPALDTSRPHRTCWMIR